MTFETTVRDWDSTIFYVANFFEIGYIDKCIELDAILPEYSKDNKDGIWSDKPLIDENENEWISADELLKKLKQLTQEEK